MSAFFHGTEDPWFKIGRLQVTTTVLVVLIGAVGMLATLFVSGLYETLALIPAQMFSGEVWRLVTWPLVDGFSLWTIINLALLWLFGRDLESQIGKRQMALLFVAIWASLTFTTTVVGLFVGGGIAGMRMIEFCLLLLWIAEWPTRRFFFNIPAWVIGIVFLALQILPMLATGAWGQLLGFVFSLVFVAMAARGAGLLSDYGWIPGRRKTKARKQSSSTRVKQPSRGQQRQAQRKATDEERIDQLLDKINAEGIHSLTRSERAELEKLRQRRR